jgi:hypothetical protein
VVATTKGEETKMARNKHVGQWLYRRKNAFASRTDPNVCCCSGKTRVLFHELGIPYNQVLAFRAITRPAKDGCWKVTRIGGSYLPRRQLPLYAVSVVFGVVARITRFGFSSPLPVGCYDVWIEYELGEKKSEQI